MNNQSFSPLSAAEMAVIWKQYMNDKAISCMLKHFLCHVDDLDIQKAIQGTLHITTKNSDALTAIFLKENMPIPLGFGEEDLNVEAPKLFSDSFYLLYLKHISNDKELFLGSYFDEKRPLTVIEISHIVSSIQTNLIAKDLILGFAQTAPSQEIQAFLLKGREQVQQHIESLSQPLMVENIPVTMKWDYGVEKSSVPPFSEKLMMFHLAAMITENVRGYGLAMSTSPRLDLALNYTNFTNEILEYAKEVSRISIEQGWLEEPPHIPFPKIHLE
jgi:hypothetical protein